jgi:hypothetical protein
VNDGDLALLHRRDTFVPRLDHLKHREWCGTINGLPAWGGEGWQEPTPCPAQSGRRKASVQRPWSTRMEQRGLERLLSSVLGRPEWSREVSILAKSLGGNILLTYMKEPARTGRPRSLPPEQILDETAYVLRTGCQWRSCVSMGHRGARRC